MRIELNILNGIFKGETKICVQKNKEINKIDVLTLSRSACF